MTPKLCVVSLIFNPHLPRLSSSSCCCAVVGLRVAQGEQSHGYEHLVRGRLGSKDGNGLRESPKVTRVFCSEHRKSLLRTV